MENESKDDNDEHNAHNAITEKMINDYLKEKDSDNKDSDNDSKDEDEKFANMVQTNQQLCDLLTKLLPNLDRPSHQRSNGGRRGYSGGQGYGRGRGNTGRGNTGQSGSGYNPNTKGKMAWRHIPPKEGEPTTKIFEGIMYKWCGTCKMGEGLWTRGVGMHDTANHDSNKSRK